MVVEGVGYLSRASLPALLYRLLLIMWLMAGITKYLCGLLMLLKGSYGIGDMSREAEGG